MQRPHILFKLRHFVFMLKHGVKMTLITKKRPLWPTLPVTCSFHDVLLQRPCPPTIGFATYFNCHINKGETPKTCLTNHKDSISHHITPLVIDSFGDGHTHTHIQTLRTKAISRNQACWPSAGVCLV